MALNLWSRLSASLGLNRRELRSWALYDVANSAFATTIMVAVLPLYFHDSLAKDLPENMRTAYWAYFNSVTMIVVALVSPSLGYIADVFSAKKKFLAVFTVTGVLSSIALAWVQPGQWMLAGLLFVLGCFSFYVGNIFYEALLPHIADEKEIHRVSNSGYAVGYIGGGVLLALNLAWIMAPNTFGLPDTVAGIKLSFISVGLCWLIFSLPLFRHVPEPETSAPGAHKVLKTSFQAVFQLFRTLAQLKKYPDVLMFLLAFWAYSDGIGTIMNMATIYGREVGIGTNDLIKAILVVQFLGVPCSFAFGPITDKIGPKKALMLTLLVYTLISMVGYFMTTTWHFWILAGGVAAVQGASQAISRSVFAQMVPLKHSGEFFGLFSVSSKFAGLFGPLVFGLLAEKTGGSRLSVLFIVLLFIMGMILLSRVDIERGKRRAQT
ncbi:MAG TPA: MFS transporter [Oligoflexus sp.]|uniref:MFS transporter n=1 Tax=Oligoflexus sp. TaxID=1971216 RepID=UPI002D7EC150|nr:MFS transporter [Oligoflexus sp.]HET9240025.1 MFS transporter [Oligoflexus sp.]